MVTHALESLRASPLLLLVLLLNMLFVLAVGYYLLRLEQYRSEDRKTLMVMLDKCLNMRDRNPASMQKGMFRSEEASCPIPLNVPVRSVASPSPTDAPCSCESQITTPE
jgi:hypothetical protein